MNETMYLFALSAPDILEQLIDRVHDLLPQNLAAATPLPLETLGNPTLAR